MYQIMVEKKLANIFYLVVVMIGGHKVLPPDGIDVPIPKVLSINKPFGENLSNLLT